jgi:hypothetical protein
MMHLYHGTKQAKPALIYESQCGLDVRFSNQGVLGQGIYFSNNSGYSNRYCYACPNGTMQQFLCLVLTGDSISQGSPDIRGQPVGSSTRLPPLKTGSEAERYDSVRNVNQGHWVVYDNCRAYPGYLITYQ